MEIQGCFSAIIWEPIDFLIFRAPRAALLYKINPADLILQPAPLNNSMQKKEKKKRKSLLRSKNLVYNGPFFSYLHNPQMRSVQTNISFRSQSPPRNRCIRQVAGDSISAAFVSSNRDFEKQVSSGTRRGDDICWNLSTQTAGAAVSMLHLHGGINLTRQLDC